MAAHFRSLADSGVACQWRIIPPNRRTDLIDRSDDCVALTAAGAQIRPADPAGVAEIFVNGRVGAVVLLFGIEAQASEIHSGTVDDHSAEHGNHNADQRADQLRAPTLRRRYHPAPLLPDAATPPQAPHSP